MKVYIVTATGKGVQKVFATKEAAEKAAREIQYDLEMTYGRGTATVTEWEVEA